ncbi:hypothetical protein LLH23_04860 [bacterium]|nr:hypothetical protein [bacterium]
MQFETLRFVGLMLLDMGRANFSLPAAKRLLLLFANAKGFPRERAEHLIRWTEGNPWRAPGCRGRAAGDLCIGRENCAYYRGKRYEKHTRDRPDSDCQTFYARGWPKWVAEREHRLYRALCELEKARGIPAGGSLFFTFGDGRDVGMGPDTQRRALADLEARGLVRVVDKGKPRTAGEHVRPRTVERVVPIPYAR